jgi:two-component system sensor histidine kinase HydH
MMKKLFDSEKKHSTELNTKLQENLNKITISEEQLKQQREHLEIEIRDKTNKLIQAERLSAIGEISARLAHDLRNPLTVIKGTVEIIKAKNKKIDTEFSSKQIEMMERAVSRMSNQIDEVLDFVKIQTLHATKNSLFETIGLSVTKIKKSTDFSINVVGNNVRFVYDADKLEVVLDNVITNAVEAINEKGQIDIRVIDNSNEIVIEIEDSGTGVPEELLTKIFEPLFTTKQRGTGLGLASCKRIIEQHGGSINVKSKPSMFIIKLPKLLEISMF